MATNSRIGWRPYVTQVVNAVDADATAFIAAAGITNLTQAAAINTLVNDLKTYGLWTKMKALYPFVGGSAASHKFNLKDPRDLDAAYRLVFNGGWVHSSTGAKPNGTTGYADTKLAPSSALSLNSTHVSYYSRTNISTLGSDFGTISNSFANNVYGYIKYTDGKTYFRVNRGGTLESNIAIVDSRLFYMINRISSIQEVLFTDSIKTTFSTNVNSTGLSPYSIYLGSLNLIGSGASDYSPRESAFASIGDGLTDTEATNFYTSVQKFQTTLGRHVGTPYVSDPDAIAFLMAAGITDGTQAVAINTLVIRMKADGVWTKMKAIYPFVGGSAASHKWNLKDPRDLDVAFRLVFNGGWTHTSTGALPNGTTGYADTKFTPSVHLTNVNSAHITKYNRTNDLTGTKVDGIYDSSTNTGFQIAYSIGSTTIGNFTSSITYTPTDTRGLFTTSRTSSTSVKAYRNAIQQGSTNTFGSVSVPTKNVILGARSDDNVAQFFYNAYEASFFSLGDGLTDSDALNLYSAVQAYQTTLGRQVNIPLVSDTDAQAFLNAANITSFQQASAVNKLVVDLKAAGVWIKMKAIYPFVGGSAATHKFNLKDPRDLDAAYRLVFNGGWTHTGTGALPNGTTGYANTYFNLQSLKQNDTHLSIYNTNNFTPISNGSIDMGAYQESGPNTSGAFIATEIATNLSRARLFFNALDYTATDNRGYYIVNSNSTNNQYFINNVSRSSIANSGFFPLINKNIFIGALNGTSFLDGAYYYSNGLYTFSSIGDGLTDTEATSLYTAVQTYQTSLGRSVNTPVYNNGLVLNLDAGNANSYPGTGTTWFDLASGNNVTLLNGPTYDATSGGSILFDGVNDYVVTNDTSFRFGNKFSISLWFYWDGLNKTNNSLFSKRMGSAGNYNQYAMGISNGDTQYGGTGKVLFFYARVDGSTGGNDPFDISITYTLPTAGFYNACIVMDTNSQKLYVNGILVGSNSKNLSGKTYNIAGRELILGASRGENATDLIAYASTKIHRFSVYSYSLTDTEVLSNFNSTRGRFGL